jgi:hypothetical protein
MAGVGDIRRGLQDIRARRRRVGLMFVAYVLVMLIVALVAEWLHLEWLIYIVGFGYFLAWAIAIQWVAYSVCPRCGKKFHSRSRWGGNPWRAACANCQLSLKEDSQAPSAN